MISDEAVEAATEAVKVFFDGKPPRGTRAATRIALKAAAPHMLAGVGDVLALHTGPTTLGSVYRCQCGIEYEPVRREIGQTDRMKTVHAAHVAEAITNPYRSQA